MKHLKQYKIFENSNSIKSELQDIFLDLKDDNPSGEWFCWVEGESVSNLYEVYISFGSEEPWEDYEDFDDDDYHLRINIPNTLIECLHRAIDYMKSLGFREKLLFVTEYSGDSSEDYVEEISIDDLNTEQMMSENEAIRLKFIK